jgi:hypothetical protein
MIDAHYVVMCRVLTEGQCISFIFQYVNSFVCVNTVLSMLERRAVCYMCREPILLLLYHCMMFLPKILKYQQNMWKKPEILFSTYSVSYA